MTTSVRSYYGPQILADEIGLGRWQFEKASATGMLPRPEHSRGWTPAQADQIRQLVPAIIERFGTEHPIGATRCAARLAARLDLPVQPCDIESLAEAGHLDVVDTFYKKGRNHDLYAPAQIDAVPTEQITAVIAARDDWTAASISADDAAEHLGWKWDATARVHRNSRTIAAQLARGWSINP